MKFVVDTNIAFSAVLNTEGKIGDLLMNSYKIFEFHSCDTLRTELEKHRGKLLEISGMTEEQLDQSIFQITNQIIFINEALIPFEFWLKGANLVRDIDMNDIAFLALTELLGVKIWTGDKELMKGNTLYVRQSAMDIYIYHCRLPNENSSQKLPLKKLNFGAWFRRFEHPLSWGMETKFGQLPDFIF